MINPFDYLFYRIYSVWKYIGGVNHCSAMGFVLLCNIITIQLLITGTYSLDFAIFVSFVVIIWMITYTSKRESRIIAKFENESNKARIIGNICVIIYMILSIVLLLIVAKYYVVPSK